MHPRKSDIAQDSVIAFCSYLLLGLIIGRGQTEVTLIKPTSKYLRQGGQVRQLVIDNQNRVGTSDRYIGRHDCRHLNPSDAPSSGGTQR